MGSAGEDFEMAKGGPYSGLFPVAPTPFFESGEIDFQGQCRDRKSVV
jgi:hypothetical protein